MPDNSGRPKRQGSDRPGGRLYGRRQDKPLKPRQAHLVATLLPRLSFGPETVASLVSAHRGPVAFEIGFGGGEHLAWQARHHPQMLCLGAEPFINGVAKLLCAVDDAELGNVRVHEGDARPCLAALPDGSLDRLFLLQPDPWPKRRHHKRRMVSQPFLRQAERLLKDGGELRISSDIPDYIRWTLMHWQAFRRAGGRLDWTAERADDWRKRPEDWPETRYMAKGERAGRPVTYLTFRRAHP